MDASRQEGVELTMENEHQAPHHTISAWLDRMGSISSDRRYFTMSTIAALIACASVYENMSFTEDDEQNNRFLSQHPFIKELIRSKSSSMVLFHFYVIIIYNLFLMSAQFCLGTIRRSELQQTKEAMVYFLVMRTMLLMGTLEEEKTDILAFILWLTIAAYIRGLFSLSSQRFNYLLSRPMAEITEYYYVAINIPLLLLVNILITYWTTLDNVFYSSHSSTLYIFEGILFGIKCVQQSLTVIYHIVDYHIETLQNPEILEEQTNEYSLLILQTILSIIYLFILIVYYSFIVTINFRASILDFILMLSFKDALIQVVDKWGQLSRYKRIILEIDSLFLDANSEEVVHLNGDVCAICLKPMERKVKKLICNHFIHRICLRQCLQREVSNTNQTIRRHSLGFEHVLRLFLNHPRVPPEHPEFSITQFRCPICRKPSILKPTQQEGSETPPRSPVQNPEQPETPEIPEHGFRISTAVLAQYLPIPVIHIEFGLPSRPVVTQAMIESVWQVLPQLDGETIRMDLEITRSPEQTIERILSGQVQQGERGRRNSDEDLH